MVDVDQDGGVRVEEHFVGRLEGLTFHPDAEGGDLEAKALRTAALRALRPEIDRRLGSLTRAEDSAFELRDDYVVMCEALNGVPEPVARMAAGPTRWRPTAVLIGGELGGDQTRARATERVTAWLHTHIDAALAPLVQLKERLDEKPVTVPQRPADAVPEDGEVRETQSPQPATDDATNATLPEDTAAGLDAGDAPASEDGTKATPADAPLLDAGDVAAGVTAPDAGEALADVAVSDMPTHDGQQAEVQETAAQEPHTETAPAGTGASTQGQTQTPTPVKPAPTPLPVPPLSSMARGLAFRLLEAGGALARRELAEEVRGLGPDDRRALRACGVRFGEHMVYAPDLVRPKAARILALVSANHAGVSADRVFLPPAGRTSVVAMPNVSNAAYEAAGYRRCGPRAVRFDILERLADLIREARDKSGQKGAFPLADPMTNLLGVSREELTGVLRALGYKRTRTGSVPESGIGPVRPEFWRVSRTPARPRPNRRSDMRGPQGGQTEEAKGPRRPRGKPGPRFEGPRAPGERQDQPARNAKPAKHGKPNHQPRHPPPREREPDPDSPFAALAALKPLLAEAPSASDKGAKRGKRRRRTPT